MDKYIIYPKQFKRANIPINKNQCFVLMPFDSKYDELYGTIKEELTNLSFVCYRDDEIPGTEPFMNKVITNILLSQFVIVVLSDFRPNVLYELGITHTFKDIQNVLIIIEKNSHFKDSIHGKSSDISHLTYVEYDPNNLIKLKANIRKFINENKTFSDFQDALKIRGLIANLSENENDFIEYLHSKLKNKVNLITCILLREAREIQREDIESVFILFESIIQQAYYEHNEQYIHPVLITYADILCSCANLNSSITEVFFVRQLESFWQQFEISDSLILQYKTDLVIYLASNKKLLETVLPWIIRYFERSKTSTIDLNRYKLESFLMTTPFEEVNNAVALSVFNENCYVREHMSDIIGEKRILQAIDNLIIQLPKEKNYYTAISMIEAIGKLGFSKGADTIMNWINNNSQEILETRDLFVLKHAVIAISKLQNHENKDKIKQFIEHYTQYLNGYDYL